MGDKTGISWTEHTFNRWWGCAKVTDACKFCYAESLAKRTGRIPEGYKVGSKRLLSKSHNLSLLKKWDKQAEAEGRKALVFAHSMSDIFDKEVSDDWRVEEFEWLAQCNNLIIQALTKRSDYPADYYSRHPYRTDNLWLGTSLGSDKDLNLAYEIVKAPAKVHWISYEPAIGHLSIGRLPPRVKWVVIGGESGPHARPFDLEMGLVAIEACRQLGITPYMKQVGQNAYYRGQPFKTEHLHGADPDEWPEELRVREFPDGFGAL